MWFNWFVTPSVLFGGGLLVAVPIVLHLVMRNKPKLFEFPALRFVKQRSDANRRKLQLRHLLLLMLRCLAVAMVAAALARPSVPSALLGSSVIAGLLGVLLLFVAMLAALSFYEKKSVWLSGSLTATALTLLIALIVVLVMTLTRGAKFNIGDDETPVAAVLLVDTSPRMQYRHGNKTRLGEAKEFAVWLLGELPRDSDVAVLDSRGNPTAFSDVIARNDVEALQITNTPRSLNRGLEDAIRLALESDKEHKEVYVLTDLTRASWDVRNTESLKRLLKQAADVQVFVIDAGSDKPKNISLGQLRLSSQSLPNDGQLRLQANLNSVGIEGTRSVELHVEKQGFPSVLDGKLVLPETNRRDQQLIDSIEAGRSVPLDFRLQMEGKGTHHGYIKIVGQDGLAIDDIRYFTVEVQNAWRVLVVAPEGVRPDNLLNVIEPYEQKIRGDSKYACDVVQQDDLIGQRLQQYAAVCLLDPEPMTPAIWEKLNSYVDGGGGLAIFLGRNARETNAFNLPAAQKLLPGKLSKEFRSAGDDLYLFPRHYDHPVLSAFRSVSTNVPWHRFPVYRYWVFKQRTPEATVVVRYGNNRPALLERAVGKGRVLTMTTPISDDSLQRDPQTWNELPMGENAWPYMVLTIEMMKHLVAAGDTQLNYSAGETALLSSHPNRDPSRYAVYASNQQLDPKRALDGSVTVQNTQQLGAYRLKGQRSPEDRVVVRGFSVNLPAQASDLTRLAKPKLDEILGKERYQFVKNRDQLHRQQREARRGFEFFPYLLIILAATLGLEHVLANRFYRKEK